MRVKKEPYTDPYHRHKVLIKEFWDNFGGTRNAGVQYSYVHKMAALVEWSGRIIDGYRNRKPLSAIRSAFDEIKAQRFRMLHIRRKCFACLGKADVRHHIIQLQNGGINCKKNVVYLCHTCHKEIHPWL